MEGTASVFEYLFVIFNSLQGVAIFLLYCVNPKVFSEYKKAAGVVSSSIFTSTSTAGGTGNTSSGGGSAHSNSTISSIRYSGRGSSPASKSSRFNSVYSNDGSPQMFQVQNLAYLVARNPEMISSSSTYLSPSPTYSSSYVSSRYASSSSTAAPNSVYNNDSIVQDDTAISISQKEESPSPLWALWADANKLARETGRPVADIYSELLNASSESDI